MKEFYVIIELVKVYFLYRIAKNQVEIFYATKRK